MVYPDTFSEIDKEKLKDPYFFKRFRRELEQGMQVKSKKNNLYFWLKTPSLHI